MTKKRAQELQASCHAWLKGWFSSKDYSKMHLSSGQTYHLAFQSFEIWLPKNTKLVLPSGGIELMLHLLKEWMLLRGTDKEQGTWK
ncbi:MAG: hypothetical protein KIT45_14800 [Fimbriimonadia bacterium]|nr:hypothetical protein [Fimbriimonadia bacterium]